MRIQLIIYILLAFCIISESAYACRLSYQENKKITQFTLLSSPAEESERSYTEGDGRNINNQYVTINGCTNGSVVSISRGLEVAKYEFPVKDVLYQNSFYHPESCKIADYPLSGSADIDRTIQLDKKFDLVSKCLRYKISSDEDVIALLAGQLSTQYDRENKLSCEFIQIDKETIQVTPKNIGSCLLPMMSTYSLKVEFEVDPACNKLEYFANTKTELQEVRAGIRFDKQEVMDGNASKESFGNLQGILHFNPNLKDNVSIANIPLTNVSYRKQLEPRYLAVWPLEISMAKLTIQEVEYEYQGKMKKEAMIQSSFLVDNRCESYCKSGLCTSPCNYSQPAYAVATINRINDSGSKTKVARNWYTGGSASAQWVGTIAGSYYRLNRSLEVGKTYEIIYQFKDPKRSAFRYLEFLKSFGDYLVDASVFSFNGDLSDLAELAEFEGVSEMESLADLDDELDSQLDGSLSASEKRFWPPVYKERWLGDRGSKPANINSGKDRSNISIVMKFKVKAVIQNQYQLENVSQSLSSTVSLEDTCTKLQGSLSVDSRTSGKPIYTCEAKFLETNISCKY